MSEEFLKNRDFFKISVANDAVQAILCQRRGGSLSDLNRITDVDGSPFDHFCCDSAVAAHRVVTAGAKHCFHSRTGLTRSAVFQQDLTHVKLLSLERQQVDSGNHQVPANQFRRQCSAMQHSRDRQQVLRLNQGDLSFGTTTAIESMVTRNSPFGNHFSLADDRDVSQTYGTESDPIESADLWQKIHQ